MARFKPACGQQELPFGLQRKFVLRKLQTTTGHEKHLLRVLDDHATNNRCECYLTLETIASEMCVSVRTASRAVQGCVAADLIAVTARRRKDRRCNTYLLRRSEMWEAAGLLFEPVGDESTRQVGISISELTGQVGISTRELIGQVGMSTRELIGQVGMSISASGVRNSQHQQEVTTPKQVDQVVCKGSSMKLISHVNENDEVSKQEIQDGRKTGGWDRKLTRAELRDAPTVLKLFQQAIDRGFNVENSERGRLEFMALCRACAIKGRNPGAYLTDCLVNGRWNLIRDEDTDAARAAVKRLVHHEPIERVSGQPPDEAADFVRRRDQAVAQSRATLAARGVE